MLHYDSEKQFQTEKKQEKKRPFLLTTMGIIVVFGFYFLVMLLLNGGGGLNGDNGSGTSITGDGPGSGSGGTNQGAGNSGIGIADGKSKGNEKGDSDVPKKTGPEQPKEEPVATSPNKETSSKKEAANEDNLLTEKKNYHIHSIAMPKDQKTAFVPRKISISQKKTAGSAPGEESDSSGGGSNGLAGKKGFFGVRTQGNTIFVVDVSSSMGSGADERRIDILKKQLKNVIKTSKDNNDGHYLIVAFSGSGCYSSPPYILYPANGKMKGFSAGLDKDVEQFIDSLYAGGNTCLLGAMKGVKEQIEKNNNKRIKTIFILTDGEPNDSSWSDIRNYIKKEIPRKIVFNTISIGQSCLDMKELAKERQGTYKDFL